MFCNATVSAVTGKPAGAVDSAPAQFKGGARRCCAAGAGTMLPAISKVLRTLKHTEDATAEPATQNCHLLCDVGMALARAIVEQHSPAGAGQFDKFPGTVPLPRYLFRQLDSHMLSRGGRA